MLPPWMLAENTGSGGTALARPSVQVAFDPAQPMPAGISVTRATTKQQVYPSDTSTSKAVNTASLEAAGLTIEAAHTNLLLRSQELDNAAWTLQGVGVAQPVVTANAAVAPDGTTTADRVDFAAVAAASGNTCGFFQAIPTTAGSYTLSCWVKGVGGTSGTFYWLQYDGSFKKAAIPFTGAWTRVVVTLSLATSGASDTEIGYSDAGSWAGTGGPASVYMWGLQLQATAYGQSYVPTTTVAAACNRDAVSGSAGLIASLPVATGRVLVTFTPEWSTATSPANAVLLDTRSATPDAGFALYVSANKLSWFGGAGIQSAALTWVAGTQYIVEAVWGGGTVTLYRDGAQVATDADTVSAHTVLKIGQLQDGSAPLDGHVSSVVFFPS